MEEQAKKILDKLNEIDKRLDQFQETMRNGFAETHKRIDRIEAKLDLIKVK